MLPNGKLRTISSLLTTFSDIVATDEASYVRMWVEEELAVAIARIPGVESSETTFSDPNYTHTIVYNGVNKTGTDTKKVDAIAKALRKLIDDLT